MAVINWYSRYVPSWRLSNTLETPFCLEALDEAIGQGRPEIFDTEQGSRFAPREYTGRDERTWASMAFPKVRLSTGMMILAQLAIMMGVWKAWASCDYVMLRGQVLTALITASVLAVLTLELNPWQAGACSPLKNRIAFYVSVMNIVVGLGMVTSDAAMGWRDCMRCRSFRPAFELQIIGIPLHRTAGPWSERTIIYKIAADLGMKCSHDQVFFIAISRYTAAGFVTGGCGTRLSDEPWYPSCAGEAVRSIAASEPGFAREFADRVLEHHDMDYLRNVTLRLQRACPPEGLPGVQTEIP